MTFYKKRLVVILVLLSLLGTVASAQKTKVKSPPSVKQVLDEASKTAKAENKTILVHFGASW